MKITQLSSLALVFTALTYALPATAADAAKDYPSRPIRLIVPNGPGSSVDTLTRIVATKLSEVLGQQLVVDNRGGAAGVIGMEIGKEANPDGYTVITATTAAMTIARLMMKNPPYHPLNDYEPVAEFAATLNVLVINPKLPINTLKDFIDYAKSGKGTFNMASAGVGSQSHLAGAYFQQEAHLKSLHVPYKGGGASSASVVSGESQWSLIPSAAAMGHVSSGRLRAIAETLPKRTALLPGIPAIAEAIPGFDYSGWQGFVVPKGTPKAIIEKLRAAVAKTMEAPEVKKALAFQATEVDVRGPAAFRKVIEESMVKNAKLVQSLGLAVN